MAQKKVILKDGGNDLLPKTLASMVFTEAGQTVEEALQNAGGGSSSGGGTGNVKVTNASGLKKDNYYAFEPSANGSVEGTFSTIPDASESKAGLMSASAYGKLYGMKPIIALPIAVLEYNAETTSETIEAMLRTAFGLNADDAAVRFLYTASVLQGEYNNGFEKFYIGDRECMLGGNAVTDGSSISQATLEFSYVDGGKLHTVAITMVVSGESGNQTYTYSAKVLESGDDTYYLPMAVAYLQSGATQAEIDTAFGGEGKFTEATRAASNKKKLYIYQGTLGLIPVSASTLFGVLGYFSFLYNSSEMAMLKHVTESKVKEIHPSGYPLNPALYSLTSSSSSDDISAAVGGESGLKEIIQAVKDGNRLVIRGELDDLPDFSVDIPLKSVVYQEGENGNLTIAFSYELFAIVSYSTYFISIQYTKSSNTFTVANSGMKSFI